MGSTPPIGLQALPVGGGSTIWDVRGDYPAGGAHSSSDGDAPPPVLTTLAPQPQAHWLRWAVVIVGWYAFGTINNVYRKNLMQLFPFPMAITTAQLAITAAGTAFMTYVLRNPAPIYMSMEELLWSIVPLGMIGLVGHVSGSYAVLWIPVSYIHTIKNTSPVFTVLITKAFNKKEYPSLVYLSLSAITLGTAISSTNEIMWSTVGFLAALVSTMAFVIQSLFLKYTFKSMHIDHTNLLFYSAMGALMFVLPIALYTDGPRLYSMWKDGAFVDISGNSLLVQIVTAGLFQFAQSMFSFEVVELSHPLTYAVLNTLKRVLVILSSIFFFSNPMTWINYFGIALSLSGDLCYFIFREPPKVVVHRPSSSV